MTAGCVLSAAAALQEFELRKIAAFCEASPSDILAILNDASDCITRVDTERPRWRVTDRAELRRRIKAAEPAVANEAAELLHARLTDQLAVTRLDYAEHTLLDWDEERPFEERRLRLTAASDALRQALAAMTGTDCPWWQLELQPAGLDDTHVIDEDVTTVARLRLTADVAIITRENLVGRTLSTRDLVAASERVRDYRGCVDLAQIFDLASRFVDLVLRQAEPSDVEAAPSRLLGALARRHVRALAERSLELGISDLVPLLKNVGRDGAHVPELYEELADLPSGQKRVVVYSDLLKLLPRHFGYQAATMRLPGTLTEAVVEGDTILQLQRRATRLEEDLVRSPYSSERALIGSTVHTLQLLTEQEAQGDASLQSRADARCMELLKLAKVSVP